MTVGDGKGTRFWLYKWCGNQSLQAKFPQVFATVWDPNGSVHDHSGRHHDSSAWNLNLRREPRDQEMQQLQELLQGLPATPAAVLPDRIIRSNNTRPLTVKEAARQMREDFTSSLPTRIIWCKWARTKVAFFVWTLFLNRLPTHDNLRRKGMQVVSRCSLCWAEEESTQHLLRDCKFSHNIVLKLHRALGKSLSNCITPCDLLCNRMHPGLSELVRLVWTVLPHAFLWATWLERNAKIFEEAGRSEEEVTESIISIIWH